MWHHPLFVNSRELALETSCRGCVWSFNWIYFRMFVSVPREFPILGEIEEIEPFYEEEVSTSPRIMILRYLLSIHSGKKIGNACYIGCMYMPGATLEGCNIVRVAFLSCSPKFDEMNLTLEAFGIKRKPGTSISSLNVA